LRSFQSGALEYARRNGIALVRVADGRTSFETKSAGPVRSFPSWLAPVPWLTQLTAEGNERYSNLGEVDIASLREAFEAHTAYQALQLAAELWNAPRHSLRSCPRRDLICSTAAECYPLGGAI
jgi:hypothetical protein